MFIQTKCCSFRYINLVHIDLPDKFKFILFEQTNTMLIYSILTYYVLIFNIKNKVNVLYVLYHFYFIFVNT